MILDNLDLSNFKLMPSQVYGSIRLIPLVKDIYDEKLKFSFEKYNALNIISVDKNTVYTSYTPHALNVSWGDHKENKKSNSHQDNSGLAFSKKMIQKVDKEKARFFPMHTAMESFLSLYFCGPDIIWEEYSGSVRKSGLSPRYEMSISGKNIQGLGRALRIFEIHENQVGVIVLVSDKLSSVFILPNPQDYKVLHKTLVEDFYSELLYYYGFMYADVPQFDFKIDENKVNSLENLKTELEKMKNELTDFYHLMSDGIFNRVVETRDKYSLGKYQMCRFLTDIDNHSENHIGEMIKDQSGNIQYMKTYLLTDRQVHRAKVLKSLALNNWHIEQTAKYLNKTYNGFILEIEKLGFGYIIKAPVLDKIRKQEKNRLK